MKTNENKTLAQLAYEAYWEGTPTVFQWGDAGSKLLGHWERVSKAVKEAVLAEVYQWEYRCNPDYKGLPTEWTLLTDADPVCVKGMQMRRLSSSTVLPDPLGTPKELHPPASGMATSSADVPRFKADPCISCGWEGGLFPTVEKLRQSHSECLYHGSPCSATLFIKSVPTPYPQQKVTLEYVTYLEKRVQEKQEDAERWSSHNKLMAQQMEVLRSHAESAEARVKEMEADLATHIACANSDLANLGFLQDITDAPVEWWGKPLSYIAAARIRRLEGELATLRALYAWVPVRERLPTKQDAMEMRFDYGEKGLVTPPKVLWSGPTFIMETPWDSPPALATGWMALSSFPPPLPTAPVVEDAFEKWEQEQGDGICMGDKRELMKAAFLAGQNSTKG